MSIRSWVWKVVKRIAVGITCILAVALLAGTIYQFAATRLDEQKYRPPGQMVDVGGHKLHLDCTGQGSPTVVLDAGLGGGALDWGLVQPEVAKFTRVCSYDRAGMAWSEAGPSPRDASQITDELHRLLTAADIAPPYVLVGHSLGGAYIQLYAAKYPNEVAGMVLVDSSHRDQLSRMSGIPVFLPYLLKALGPVGVARISGGFIELPPQLSAETNAERNAMYLRTASIYSVADEMTGIRSSMEELRTSPMDLGNKPLIVLVRGLSEDSKPETEAIWLELQTDHAKLSSNSKLIIAKQSGHYIQFFEPQLVVDSIRQVVQGSSGSAHL